MYSLSEFHEDIFNLVGTENTEIELIYKVEGLGIYVTWFRYNQKYCSKYSISNSILLAQYSDALGCALKRQYQEIKYMVGKIDYEN